MKYFILMDGFFIFFYILLVRFCKGFYKIRVLFRYDVIVIDIL